MLLYFVLLLRPCFLSATPPPLLPTPRRFSFSASNYSCTTVHVPYSAGSATSTLRVTQNGLWSLYYTELARGSLFVTPFCWLVSLPSRGNKLLASTSLALTLAPQCSYSVVGGSVGHVLSSTASSSQRYYTILILCCVCIRALQRVCVVSEHRSSTCVESCIVVYF